MKELVNVCIYLHVSYQKAGHTQGLTQSKQGYQITKHKGILVNIHVSCPQMIKERGRREGTTERMIKESETGCKQDRGQLCR